MRGSFSSNFSENVLRALLLHTALPRSHQKLFKFKFFNPQALKTWTSFDSWLQLTSFTQLFKLNAKWQQILLSPVPLLQLTFESTVPKDILKTVTVASHKKKQLFQLFLVRVQLCIKRENNKTFPSNKTLCCHSALAGWGRQTNFV